MSETAWQNVDGYFTELLHENDPVLEQALAACAEADLPEIQVSKPQGKLLHLLARFGGAKRILELGTLGGFSAIWLARALPEGGKLVTLEYEPKHAEVAGENLRRAGLEDKVEIRVGDARDTLAELETEGAGPFDLVFLDADKENYPNYLPSILRLSRPGALLIADNIVRDGEVVNPENPDPRVQGVRAFNDLVAAEPGLDATGVQTVGAKGYDGFVMGVVKG